jgi:hypothetical protein
VGQLIGAWIMDESGNLIGAWIMDESGNTSSTAFLAIDWKANWEKVCAERDGLVVERDRYRKALEEIVETRRGAWTIARVALGGWSP